MNLKNVHEQQTIQLKNDISNDNITIDVVDINDSPTQFELSGQTLIMHNTFGHRYTIRECELKSKSWIVEYLSFKTFEDLCSYVDYFDNKSNVTYPHISKFIEMLEYEKMFAPKTKLNKSTHPQKRSRESRAETQRYLGDAIRTFAQKRHESMNYIKTIIREEQ